MRPPFGMIALVVLAGCGVAACSSSTTASPTTAAGSRNGATVAPSTTAARKPGESDGAYVFRTQCAGCHGTQGEGNVGPPLSGIATKLTPAQEEAIVRNGQSRMPPFSPALSDAEIAAVIEYTRTQLG